MGSKINLGAIFRREAEVLLKARETAMEIHPTDLRAAGSHVEGSVRGYLRRMLPPRYHVTSGHLIDEDSLVSPQIDVIIADNFGIPSLLTTQDCTEYVPISSVLAIGEVKSTYYKSKSHFEKAADDLREISGMARPLVENTAYDGVKGETLLEHMILPLQNKYLNSLFSFMLCIDGGDFDFADIKDLLLSEDPQFLPGTSVLLNKGVLVHARLGDKVGIMINKYPAEVSSVSYDWCYFEGFVEEGGSPEGSHLAFLYGALVQHLANCRLEPPDAYRYTAKLSSGRRSSLEWAKTSGD